ncbi:neuronal acetylcholine receptor subunit alpha-6-like [Convolutriloba macropyga]|uniref:neuronal acetylcholine receptor subunit alpha-6-like n=1 Tax=Convolutriloba macropyga TaxID=536237 RepID=UPI003F526F8D
MLKFIVAIIAVLSLRGSSNSNFSESNLRLSLIAGNDMSVIPVKNASNGIQIHITIYLYQLVGIDHKAQTIKLLMFVKWDWTDEYIHWQPSSNEGVYWLRYGKRDLWTPDILPYNDVGDHEPQNFESTIPLLVRYDGLVSLRQPSDYQEQLFTFYPNLTTTTCSLDVTKFPFDEQTCYIQMGSWMHNASYVRVDCDPHVNLASYVTDSLWTLERASCSDSLTEVTTNGRFSFVVLTLVYRRLPKFYVQNLILPNAFLLSLSSLTFFIPGNTGEKIGFGVTVTLALCVNLMIVVDFVPETSQTFPLICTYYFLSIVLSCFSLLLATVSVNWETKKCANEDSNIATSEFQLNNITNLRNNSGIPRRNEGPGMEVWRKMRQIEINLKNLQELFAKLSKQSVDRILGLVYLIGSVVYSVLFIAYIQS